MFAGVILAAGASSRLGTPKQLLPLDGRPLLQHVLDSAASAALDPIVLVLGHQAAEVEAAVALPAPARVVRNPDHGEGQATSLRCGLAALEAEVRAAVILLGDQPRIAPAAIREALAAYQRTGGPVVRTMYRGRPGHPVLLDRSIWPTVMAQSGDQGARDVLERHPEWIVTLERREDPPADIDSLEDYERLTEG